MNGQYGYEEASRIRRRERIMEMRRRKRRQMMLRRIFRILMPAAGGIAFLSLLLLFGFKVFRGTSGEDGAQERKGSDTAKNLITAVEDQAETVRPEEKEEAEETSASGVSQWVVEAEEQVAAEAETAAHKYAAQTTENTASPEETVLSSNVLFLELDTGNILVQRGYREKICPASMTKILTVLVAAEHVKDLDDTFTITPQITDYAYVHDCSIAGFEKEETVTVRDLFYGTILPSGADAAVGLATYVAGSQEAFVELMNGRLESMGLAETAHFTNCVGIYEEEHYCTVYDMAMILEAAIDNALCREVLSAHTYTTSETPQHPEGIMLSNWFLRRIEDKDTGGEVICGKTGYVAQSGNCAASYGVDSRGREYICVTVNAPRVWRCIYDQVELYKKFAGEEGE